MDQPPIEDPGAHTVVWWKFEDEDGEDVGPVWVETGDDPDNPERTVDWEIWVRRSAAEKYASDNGYEFRADD